MLNIQQQNKDFLENIKQQKIKNCFIDVKNNLGYIYNSQDINRQNILKAIADNIKVYCEMCNISFLDYSIIKKFFFGCGYSKRLRLSLKRELINFMISNNYIENKKGFKTIHTPTIKQLISTPPIMSHYKDGLFIRESISLNYCSIQNIKKKVYGYYLI